MAVNKVHQTAHILQYIDDESTFQVFEKVGNAYHLHFVRKREVANGTAVSNIPQEYAPSSAKYGWGFYKQASGYGLVAAYVNSSWIIKLQARQYDDPLAGAFDVYW